MADSSGHPSIALDIPILLKTQTREVSGRTFSCSHEQLLISASSPLRTGTPLSLHFTFGNKVCYLALAGQVVESAHVSTDSGSSYSIEIRLAGVREFEQTILRSALEEVRRDPSAYAGSLVTIEVSNDVVAEEAHRLTTDPASSEPSRRPERKRAKFTPDPEWVARLKHHITPYWEAILRSPLVQEASAGILPLTQMRAWMSQLYPFIETFPKWLALNLTKAEDPRSRGYLIENIRVEKKHADQWLHMAQGFGIPHASLQDLRAIPAVDAITHWLWSINTQGSLAEGVAATSYAIEGVTHDIAVMVVKGFPKYDGQPGVQLDKRTYWWMEAHAKYDDLHPVQALEIMKVHTHSAAQEERVIFAAQRSLEFLRMALDACYQSFPADADQQAWQVQSERLQTTYE